MYTDNPYYKKFIGSIYENKLQYYLDNLDEDILYQSWTHGKLHIIRTMTYGALIAQNENFTPLETDLLLLSCSYHDIGRIDDRYAPEHGTNSAKLIEEGKVEALNCYEGDYINIIKAAIAAHSDHDSNMELYLNRFKVIDKSLFYKIARALKDADNLDRVRIGDLNTDYLRTETAKQLPDFAQDLFDFTVPDHDPVHPWKKISEV